MSYSRKIIKSRTESKLLQVFSSKNSTQSNCTFITNLQTAYIDIFQHLKIGISRENQII